MQCVYIIGGIGSGKSSVCDYLAHKGYPVLDLDQVGHVCIEDISVIKSLVQHFGHDILDSQGSINRQALAQKVFSKPDKLACLNAIMMPEIQAYEQTWCDAQVAQGERLVAIEVSAYNPDRGLYCNDQALIVGVFARPDLRLERLLGRGMKEDDIQQRIASQVGDERRRSWCDVMLENNGDRADLEAQIDTWLESVTKESLS